MKEARIDGNQEIGLIALDLDGTLLKHDGSVSEEDIAAILKAAQLGVHTVISTGRPYVGLPFEVIEKAGIHYAITTNGAAVYKVPEKECIFEQCIPFETALEVIGKLLTFDVHFDVFVDGCGYSQLDRVPIVQKLEMPQKMKDYIIGTRTKVEDIVAYLEETKLSIQKMTVNFYPEGNGSYKDRDAVKAYLESVPGITFLCGGYHNWEITRAGVKKGMGLTFLAEHFSLALSQTMACGDSENDLDIMKIAGVGVAMANASEDVLEIADFISKSNEENGVAWAIEHFVCKRKLDF